MAVAAGRTAVVAGTTKSPWGSPMGKKLPTCKLRTRCPDIRPPPSTFTVTVMQPSRRSGDDEIE